MSVRKLAAMGWWRGFVYTIFVGYEVLFTLEK